MRFDVMPVFVQYPELMRPARRLASESEVASTALRFRNLFYPDPPHQNKHFRQEQAWRTWPGAVYRRTTWSGTGIRTQEAVFPRRSEPDPVQVRQNTGQYIDAGDPGTKIGREWQKSLILDWCSMAQAPVNSTLCDEAGESFGLESMNPANRQTENKRPPSKELRYG